MELEVLISTMKEDCTKIPLDMNLKTDAIIISQCNKNDFEIIINEYSEIKVYKFNEKGVGKSRNSALLRSTKEICLMADDDVVYYDDYAEKVINAFKEMPEADMIIFNVLSNTLDRPEYFNEDNKRLRWYNVLKYPTFRIAFKSESQKLKNIYFSQLFGGGAKYSCGEDSIFIYDFLKNGLKIYASKETIGVVEHSDSTWFKGYNEKYFFDKGVLYSQLFGKWGGIMSLQYLLRHYKKFNTDISKCNAFKYMYKGIRSSK